MGSWPVINSAKENKGDIVHYQFIRSVNVRCAFPPRISPGHPACRLRRQSRGAGSSPCPHSCRPLVRRLLARRQGLIARFAVGHGAALLCRRLHHGREELLWPNGHDRYTLSVDRKPEQALVCRLGCPRPESLTLAVVDAVLRDHEAAAERRAAIESEPAAEMTNDDR